MKAELYIKKIIPLFLLALFIQTIKAQQRISTETIEFRPRAKLFSFSEADGNYIVDMESNSIRIICYDTAFKLNGICTQSLKEIKNDAQLVGAGQLDGTIVILLTNKWVSQFSAMIYDMKAGKWLNGFDYDMDGYVYLNWFIRDRKFNLLSVKKDASILEIVSFDLSGKNAKTSFDLSKESFSDLTRQNLHDALIDAFNSSAVVNLSLKKALSGYYQTDIDVRGYARLYCNENELFITINKTGCTTHVIRLDLLSGNYEHEKIPYPKSLCQEYVGNANSFIIGHKLLAAVNSPAGICLGIYDMDNKKYLKEWGPGFAPLDSIISSPLLSENSLNGNIDTISSWEKFYKTTVRKGLFSLAADQNESGTIDIYLGEEIEKLGYSGMVADLTPKEIQSGSISLTKPNIGIPGSSLFQNLDGPPIVRHAFFKITLNARTFEKANPTPESNSYQKYKTGFYNTLSSEVRRNITLFNRGTSFYVGYYHIEQNNYSIFKYK